MGDRLKMRCTCALCYTPRLSMCRTLQGQSGFTLMETVLALFLFLLIVQCVMAVFWQAFLATERTQLDAELQYSLRRTRHHLGPDLARCCQVQVKDALEQNADSGPHLYLTMTGEMVHYYLNNGQLYRDTSTGSPLPLAGHIDSLTFSQRDSGWLVLQVAAVQGQSRLEHVSSFKFGRYATEVIQSGED